MKDVSICRWRNNLHCAKFQLKIESSLLRKFRNRNARKTDENERIKRNPGGIAEDVFKR